MKTESMLVKAPDVLIGFMPPESIEKEAKRGQLLASMILRPGSDTRLFPNDVLALCAAIKVLEAALEEADDDHE